MNQAPIAPPGWTAVRLAEVARVVRPRVSPVLFPDLPFIGMENVEAQTMRLLGTVPASSMKSGAVQFESGDVLYGRLRPYLNKVYRPDFRGLCSAEFIVLTPTERLDGEYLQNVLNSGPFVRFATGLNTGDRPRVDFAQIGAYQVLLPPKLVQRQLVSDISAVSSRVAAARSSLMNAREGLARYRETVIRAAYSGIEDFASLIDLCSAFVDCAHRTPKYGSGDVPALRPRDVVGGVLDHVNAGRVSEAEYQRQVVRHVPVAGDVVYSRELSYGWAAQIPSGIRLCLGQGMVLFRLSEVVLPRWVVHFLNGPEGRRQAADAATGTAHPHINLNSIRQYRIPVAPLGLQQERIAQLERHLSVIDELHREIETSAQRGDAVREAMLARALWSGVDQHASETVAVARL